MTVRMNELRRFVLTADMLLVDATRKTKPSMVVVKDKPELNISVPIRIPVEGWQGCYIVPGDLQIQDLKIHNFLPLTLGEVILAHGVPRNIYGSALAHSLSEQIGGLQGLSRRYQEIVQDLQIKGELQLSRQDFSVTIGDWDKALIKLAKVPDNLTEASKITWTFCQLLLMWAAWMEIREKFPWEASSAEQLLEVVNAIVQFRRDNLPDTGQKGLI